MPHPKNFVPIKNLVLEMYNSHDSSKLTYHGYHHVMNVLEAANEHIKRLKINSKDAHLVRIAALLHDIGILWTYNKHEQKGVEFIKANLNEYGYSKNEIDKICSIVLATELPQKPKNLLEKIVCDSDLDYLGRDTFYDIGETLFKEFMFFDIVKNRREWDLLQVRFLENHKYHTDFAKRILQPRMNKRLLELKEKLNIS